MMQVSAGGSGSDLGISEWLYLKWLGTAAKIQQQNQVVNAACVELVRQYTHDGLSCCILKGQGNLVNYKTSSNSPCLGGGTDDTDLGMYRTPGDIDVWCTPADPCGIEIAVGDLDPSTGSGQVLKGAHGVYAERSRSKEYHGKQAVIEYVRMLWRLRHDNTSTSSAQADNDNYEVRYHHIDAPSINTSTGSAQAPVEVEVHFRPLFLDSPLRNHRLQNWFKLNEQFGVHDAKIGDCVIPVPTVSFNAV